MLKKLRKSSSRVTLVLIGVAAISGCAEKRDVYASREDCLADWGNTPADCTPATGSGHAGRGFYYGPSYRGSSGSSWFGSNSKHSMGSTRTSSSSSSSSSSSRGGFGFSGRSSSSSSSGG
ncbi:hypothetical protein [Usitatibacter palustris]|uniref:Lipoprotein n=1 Tax=Usitatibacter palustris TaxID=2732487 RepID=A0A6M4HA01_9PROT|nr:hypothetical protein [Usitatibacter palustris]QJR16430.1 hypothetical protein DSM104440_03265 [Usitatibacter palustris]